MADNQYQISYSIRNYIPRPRNRLVFRSRIYSVMGLRSLSLVTSLLYDLKTKVHRVYELTTRTQQSPAHSTILAQVLYMYLYRWVRGGTLNEIILYIQIFRP